MNNRLFVVISTFLVFRTLFGDHAHDHVHATRMALAAPLCIHEGFEEYIPAIRRPFFSPVCSLDQLRELHNVAPILILGSGVAGLQAGVYGRRQGMPTYILTGPVVGGQLLYAGIVENMPAIKPQMGADIIATHVEQAERFGVTMIDDQAMSVDLSTWPFKVTTEHSGTIHALSLIITTGAAARRLNIPGELAYWGAGVSACAICDGPMFKGKNTAIVGGGDTAAEQAFYLAPHAKHVTIYVRKDHMRAAKRLQDRLKEYDNVTIVYNKEVLEAVGIETVRGPSLTGIVIRDTATGHVETVSMEGLFIAIGHNPNTELFIHSLNLTKAGYIWLDSRSQETNVHGVFAAGDVCDNLFRQSAMSTGQATQAALEALHFLSSIGINHRTVEQLRERCYPSTALHSRWVHKA